MANSTTPPVEETDTSSLSLAEREIRVKEREIWLKEQEAARNRWLSPLVVALVVAGLGALTNAGIAYYNAASDRRIAAANAAAEREKQERAAQAALILKSLDDGDVAKAEERIKFLTDSHLVSDPQIVNAFISYLANNWINSGPFAGLPLTEQDVCEGVKLFSPPLAQFKSPPCQISVSSLSEVLETPREEITGAFPNEDSAVSRVTCKGGKASLSSPFPADATDVGGWCILVTGPTTED